MPVYVDKPRHRLGRMIMCHMAADTDEELHAMADKIGIDRRHFQGDHYDICKLKRRAAIAAGAREVSAKELCRVARKLDGAVPTAVSS